MLTNLALALMLAVQATPPVPAFTLESCNDPTARKALLAAGPDGVPIFRTFKERGQANEARMDLLLDRLAARARLSKEERGQVALNILDDRRFLTVFVEGMAFIEQAMTATMKLSGEDNAANCRTVVEMSSRLPAIDANAQKQWSTMRILLEEEARRRGVSLAD